MTEIQFKFDFRRKKNRSIFVHLVAETDHEGFRCGWIQPSSSIFRCGWIQPSSSIFRNQSLSSLNSTFIP